jgi:hypothetical protein
VGLELVERCEEACLRLGGEEGLRHPALLDADLCATPAEVGEVDTERIPLSASVHEMSSGSLISS